MFGDDLTAYLPEHIKPFSEQLRQFPSGYEKWVYATSFPKETYQGDVFSHVPLVAIDEAGEAVRAETNAMVLSCTCDVQLGQGETLLVAPVINLQDYISHSELEGRQLDDHIESVTHNKLSAIMFLPKGAAIERSLVDFGKTSPISVEYFHLDRGQKRLASLSQYGHYFLLVKLAYHFCRPDAPDAKRS